MNTTEWMKRKIENWLTPDQLFGLTGEEFLYYVLLSMAAFFGLIFGPEILSGYGIIGSGWSGAIQMFLVGLVAVTVGVLALLFFFWLLTIVAITVAMLILGPRPVRVRLLVWYCIAVLGFGLADFLAPMKAAVAGTICLTLDFFLPMVWLAQPRRPTLWTGIAVGVSLLLAILLIVVSKVSV